MRLSDYRHYPLLVFALLVLATREVAPVDPFGLGLPAGGERALPRRPVDRVHGPGAAPLLDRPLGNEGATGVVADTHAGGRPIDPRSVVGRRRLRQLHRGARRNVDMGGDAPEQLLAPRPHSRVFAGALL